jgi:hypothetical protein
MPFKESPPARKLGETVPRASDPGLAKAWGIGYARSGSDASERGTSWVG